MPLSTIPTPPTDIMPAPQAGHVWNLIDLWLAGIAETSARSYRSTLADFAGHLDIALELAVGALLADRARGHALAMGYKARLLELKKAPNTINLRLAALRSLVAQARQLGLVDWSLEVAGVKAQKYRDTRGPGRGGFRALLAAASTSRDRAILWLLFGVALRRGEVSALDLEHVQGDVLMICGKGSRERTPVTMPQPVRSALATWLAERGPEPGPLFKNKNGGRLSAWSYNDLLERLSRKAKIDKARPHGLRHAAATEALTLTQGDLRKVARFTRHADVRTLMIYDDNREDLGGAVAALVAGAADL